MRGRAGGVSGRKGGARGGGDVGVGVHWGCASGGASGGHGASSSGEREWVKPLPLLRPGTSACGGPWRRIHFLFVFEEESSSKKIFPTTCPLFLGTDAVR